MLPFYRSVKIKSRIEIEEKRSKFIAVCSPIDTEEEAISLIHAMKKEFPDASHHVYAWLLGRNQHLQRYSDAGEPQGTAGLPVMRVLQKNNLIQTAVVVTRYFGGIQLGAGGLGRAYSSSASAAIKAAGLATYRLCQQYRMVIEYVHLDPLKRHCEQSGYACQVSDYGMDAEMLVAVPNNEAEKLIQFCTDLTAGAALYAPVGQIYVPLPLPDPPGDAQADF